MLLPFNLPSSILAAGFAPIFEECVMLERTLVFTLVIANLANVACLYAYL